MESKLISASDAARRLNVHPKTVSRLLRVGGLTGQKIANRWLVEEATLAKFGKGYVGKRGWKKGRARGLASPSAKPGTVRTEQGGKR